MGDLPKFDAMLDMNDPDFAAKLREAIGAAPDERIEVTTPQFDRTDGVTVKPPLFDFSALPSLPKETLRAIGCGMWDDPDENGNVLWLYPAEWYDHIPEGHTVHVINGKEEAFRYGITDDDRRFGMLAYGFLRPERILPDEGESK